MTQRTTLRVLVNQDMTESAEHLCQLLSLLGLRTEMTLDFGDVITSISDVQAGQTPEFDAVFIDMTSPSNSKVSAMEELSSALTQRSVRWPKLFAIIGDFDARDAQTPGFEDMVEILAPASIDDLELNLQKQFPWWSPPLVRSCHPHSELLLAGDQVQQGGSESTSGSSGRVFLDILENPTKSPSSRSRSRTTHSFSRAPSADTLDGFRSDALTPVAQSRRKKKIHSLPLSPHWQRKSEKSPRRPSLANELSPRRRVITSSDSDLLWFSCGLLSLVAWTATAMVLVTRPRS